VLEEGGLQRHPGRTRGGTDMAVCVEGDELVDRPKCSVRGSHWMQSGVGRKDQR
jgi:hypothetical protein